MPYLQRRRIVLKINHNSLVVIILTCCDLIHCEAGLDHLKLAGACATALATGAATFEAVTGFCRPVPGEVGECVTV